MAQNGGAWEYLLPDALDSVRQLSDAQGNIVQSYTYAPFGELLAATGSRASALRYTGEQTDLDTGLVYLRARWYDSATGRFTTRDPFRGLAGYPRTQHPYVYSGNNPINLTDPSGEFFTPETIWDLVIVGGDLLLMFIDWINPCLTAQERETQLAWDRIALGFDLAAAAAPFIPGGGGLAGRGTVALAQVVVRVPEAVRFGQVIAKGAQAGTHLAQASKGSGKGSSQSKGREYSFPGKRELAKRLGVSEDEFHRIIKPEMEQEFRREMKKIGTTNPDIGIDLAGNIVLKHPDTGRVIETGMPLDYFRR